MRGFLIVYGEGVNNVLLVSDSFLDIIFNNYKIANSSGNTLINQVKNGGHSVYISEENYPKVEALDKASQFDLLRELYHTLKAEESIVDRENRIMELNNKITNVDESITE